MTETRPSQLIYRDATAGIAERVRDLVARMTLDEKIAQLGSFWVYELQDEQGFSEDKAAALIGQGVGQMTRVGGGSTLAPREIAAMSNAIQSYLTQRTRLGIPALVHEECCSGYMALGATCFPQIIETLLENKPELAALLKCDPHSNGIVDGSVRAPTILDAIREHVSSDTSVIYAQGCSIDDGDISGLEAAKAIARQSDAVILVVGDKSGLAIGCTSGESRDRADLGLPGGRSQWHGDYVSLPSTPLFPFGHGIPHPPAVGQGRWH